MGEKGRMGGDRNERKRESFAPQQFSKVCAYGPNEMPIIIIKYIYKYIYIVKFI